MPQLRFLVALALLASPALSTRLLSEALASSLVSNHVQPAAEALALALRLQGGAQRSAVAALAAAFEHGAAEAAAAAASLAGLLSTDRQRGAAAVEATYAQVSPAVHNGGAGASSSHRPLRKHPAPCTRVPPPPCLSASRQ